MMFSHMPWPFLLNHFCLMLHSRLRSAGVFWSRSTSSSGSTASPLLPASSNLKAWGTVGGLDDCSFFTRAFLALGFRPGCLLTWAGGGRP